MKIKNFLLFLITFSFLSLFTSEAKANYCVDYHDCHLILDDTTCGSIVPYNASSGDACRWSSGSCISRRGCSSLGAGATSCDNVAGCKTVKYLSVSATADDNKLVETLCNALKIVTGSGGKAFAAFAIISVGIGFFTGKVSWGLMIGVSAGIAAMFGAPTIVAAISGEDTVDCSA
jgi:type IV secretory pathway VirB2 component (pilin)